MPDGLIHDGIGAVFVPATDLKATLAPVHGASCNVPFGGGLHGTVGHCRGQPCRFAALPHAVDLFGNVVGILSSVRKRMQSSVPGLQTDLLLMAILPEKGTQTLL